MQNTTPCFVKPAGCARRGQRAGQALHLHVLPALCTGPVQRLRTLVVLCVNEDKGGLCCVSMKPPLSKQLVWQDVHSAPGQSNLLLQCEAAGLLCQARGRPRRLHWLVAHILQLCRHWSARGTAAFYFSLRGRPTVTHCGFTGEHLKKPGVRVLGVLPVRTPEQHYLFVVLVLSHPCT